MTIVGAKVKRPEKADLVREIALELGIDDPPVSRGSSVDSKFLDAVHAALTGEPANGGNANRNVELVLTHLGLTYDPYWDTSEATASQGGSTVTTRAYSRILARMIDRPRCFVLNTTDAPVGTRWEETVDKGSLYRYDGTVTGRRPFNEAGPGSRVIYYSTSKSSVHPMHYISCAEVVHIAPGWSPPKGGGWEAKLEGYREFPAPVPADHVEVVGRNNQHAISEITWNTYQEILVAGGIGPEEPVAARAGLEDDPGAGIVARKIVETTDVTWDPTVTLEIPDTVDLAHTPKADWAMPAYEVEDNGTLVQKNPAVGLDFPRQTQSDRDRNREAEKLAIAITKTALTSTGWTLLSDQQAHGVGYDLLFGNGDQRLKVEVKGIIGRLLQFNVTPKEFWVAENDPDFLLVVVTQVLSPAYKVHTMRADRLLTARRSPTGYRISLSS
ncbi:DUF3883 domain-containing protein [Promicromonospora soli]